MPVSLPASPSRSPPPLRNPDCEQYHRRTAIDVRYHRCYAAAQHGMRTEGKEQAMDAENAAAKDEGEATASDWMPTERISWFPIPQEKDLDPRVADLVRRQRERLGAPNNVVRVHSWRPDLMLKWLDFYDQINRGPSGLSRIDREMIGVVVSADNRCML